MEVGDERARCTRMALAETFWYDCMGESPGHCRGRSKRIVPAIRIPSIRDGDSIGLGTLAPMLQHLLNTTATGATWFFSALAFTVVFRTYGLFDVSIAAALSASAFLTVEAHSRQWGWAAGWGLGWFCSAIILASARYLAIRGALSRRAGSEGLLATLGIFAVTASMLQVVWGPEVRIIAATGVPLRLGHLTLSWPQGVQLLLLLLGSILFAAYLRSGSGLAMRAVAHDPTLAQLHGVSVMKTHVAAVALASAACASAGLSMAVSGGASAYSGMVVLLYGITAAFLGYGRQLAAPLIGVVALVPSVAVLRSTLPSRWSEPALFLLLFFALGLRGREIATLPVRQDEST